MYSYLAGSQNRSSISYFTEPENAFTNLMNPSDYTQLEIGVDDSTYDSEELKDVLHLSKGDEHRNKLGTIAGVYVPCCLNIMGVILFLRMGWSVGQVGVLGTLLILLIAETQTILTVLSLTAIVTNGSMKGGGSYYMISRSLGPELGGAIGLLFYLAYAVGASFYVIGFAEELQYTFYPDNTSSLFLTAIGSAVLFVILCISLLGAKYFTKVNTVVFIIQYFAVLFALISFWFAKPKNLNGGGRFDGLGAGNISHNLWFDFSICDKCDGKLCSFRAVFAIIFPAATGIMEGANLSGDLKDPKKSIGLGTLMAIGSAILTYIAIILTEASAFDRETLKTNDYIMQDTAYVKELVVLGILISASSSALGAVFGGSRVLQALGRDKLFPYTEWLGVGSEGADEPRRAVLCTWVIAQACLFIGGLDVIAPVISMFFCLSYAITNFSALLLKVSGTPNFRPGFKYFNSWTALTGGVLNLAVMFWLEVWYASVATICLILIFIYLNYRSFEVSWGDVSQALLFHQVRKYLLRLDERKSHGKLWRPSVLHYVSVLDSPLSEFCNRLKKGGLYILGCSLVGDFELLRSTQSRMRNQFMTFIRKTNLKAFPEVGIAPTARIGFQNLILLGGLGALSPNTVVLEFWNGIVDSVRFEGDEDKQVQKRDHMEHYSGIIENMDRSDYSANIFNSIIQDVHEYINMMGDVLMLEKNLVVACNFDHKESEVSASNELPERSIDVWLTDPSSTTNWEEFRRTSLTLVQLAHIMYLNASKDVSVKTRGGSNLRVFLIVSEDRRKSYEKSKLELLLSESRINVMEIIIVSQPNLHITNMYSDISAAVSINQVILPNAVHSEMTFMYLPCSSVISAMDSGTAHNLLETLSILSRNISKLLFVSPGDLSDLMSREL